LGRCWRPYGAARIKPPVRNYFCETAQTKLIQTDEGILHWIPESELLKREYTKTFAAMLKHYTTRHPQDRAVYVGVAGNGNGSLSMTWTLLEDFE